MAYRDELQAAHDRAVALERENDDLRDKLALAIAEQPRALVTTPEKFTVDTRGDQLRITWRAPQVNGFAVLLRLLFFTTMLRMAYGGDGLVFYGALTQFVIWTYLDAARLVTRVTLTAGEHGVTRTCGPLPWSPPLRLPRERIVQLFVERRGGEFALCAIDAHDEKVIIIDGLTDVAHAHWLEATLERHLCIPAQPVAGELAP